MSRGFKGGVRIVIPGKPVPNRREHKGLLIEDRLGDLFARVHSYKPTIVLARQALVREQVRRALQEGAPTLDGPLNLSYEVYRRVPSGKTKQQMENILAGIEEPIEAGDWDNTLKVDMDACQSYEIKNKVTGEIDYFRGIIANDSRCTTFDGSGKFFAPIDYVVMHFTRRTKPSKKQILAFTPLESALGRLQADLDQPQSGTKGDAYSSQPAPMDKVD